MHQGCRRRDAFSCETASEGDKTLVDENGNGSGHI